MISWIFWLHDFLDRAADGSRTSQIIPTFVAAIDEDAQKQLGYAYFLTPIGSTQLLIGQHVPHGTSLPEFGLQVSAYVEPLGGHFRRFRRARNQLFAPPNRMLRLLGFRLCGGDYAEDKRNTSNFPLTSVDRIVYLKRRCQAGKLDVPRFISTQLFIRSPREGAKGIGDITFVY